MRIAITPTLSDRSHGSPLLDPGLKIINGDLLCK